MTPAFTYADGLPLDLGEDGLLGPVPQVATDALADPPEDGDGEPNRVKRRG